MHSLLINNVKINFQFCWGTIMGLQKEYYCSMMKTGKFNGPDEFNFYFLD
jgi:hypothetical protein